MKNNKIIMDQVEIHENCDCIIVHPTGQIQTVKECWCKVYHTFGQNIQIEDVAECHVEEDIHCYYIRNHQKMNLPPNGFLERKLKKKIFGAGIFFRKGTDITLNKAKDILTR